MLHNVVYMYDFMIQTQLSATARYLPENADSGMPPNNKAPMHWNVNNLTTAGSLVISLGVTQIGEFV